MGYLLGLEQSVMQVEDHDQTMAVDKDRAAVAWICEPDVLGSPDTSQIAIAWIGRFPFELARSSGIGVSQCTRVSR